MNHPVQSRFRLAIRMLPLLSSMLLAACASAPSATPETVTFHPSLQVSLEQMTRLGSGVYIRDVRVGDGATARRGNTVAVHYAGWLPDGTLIDGVAAPSPATEFRLGGGTVIEGWESGIVGMRQGGQRLIVVPARLAYGARGEGAVPPHSVLVFLIELVRVRPN